MQIQNDNSEEHSLKLQSYLDGEMPISERLAFEAHAADCRSCRIEIELHREISEMPAEVELPKDFSRVIAANAESQVSGLRKRNERKITLAIIAGLVLLAFAVVGGSGRTSTVVFFVIERIGALASVIGSFFYNLLFGVVVVVKVAAAQFEFPPMALAGVFVIGLAGLISYLYFTGRFAALRHAKR